MVTHDVPPYTIVAGNPAKVIRRRFDDEIISKLEKISWWNWPIKNINESLKDIVHGDVNNLWRYAVDNKLSLVS